MTKWTIRRPDMYQNIPEDGYQPRSGVALLVALLLYLIYSAIAMIPALVHAAVILAPHIHSGLDMSELIDIYKSDPSTLLVSLFLTALLILTTIFYIRRIEKRPLSTIGLSRGRIARRYLSGFGIGVALIALTIWPLFLTQEVAWKGFTPIVALFLAAFIIQGASEEVLFRGFLLSAISRKIGIAWAVVLSSALFASMHFVTITSLLDVLTLFMMAVLMALLTIRTNSLWAACGLHTAWNFVTGLLAPVNAGGLDMDYSVITIGDPNAAAPDYGFFGDPFNLFYIAVFAIAIAIVLSAGKNRLITKRPEAERSLFCAKRYARAALPEGYLAYANVISKMVCTDDEKAALLVGLMLERGITAQALANAGVGETAGVAAMMLARRPGESDGARYERLRGNPVAETVWQAQARYAADYAYRQAVADWQARCAAEWQAHYAAEWQARQETERQAYIQRYADKTKARRSDDVDGDDGDGTLGY